MILVIEDDILMNKGICHTLEKEGHEVMSSQTYDEGLKLAINHRPSLILLDINLKGKSGIVLCQELRKVSDVPIIFITAKDTDKDMIEGFDAGADDYISKPFALAVLKKRVEAILRRAGQPDEDLFRDGNLVIDYGKKTVAKDGQTLKLTATEYKLVEVLSRNKGQVLTREKLLQKLWDIDGNFVEENTLSVHMRRLRMKLEEDAKNPILIVTVFGIGYTWGR
ncbi:MAG: response regulator transcription factor [Cellulosilyticaceae bacterium]